MKRMLIVALCVLVFAGIALAQYNGGDIQSGATSAGTGATGARKAATTQAAPTPNAGDFDTTTGGAKDASYAWPTWFGAVDKLGAHQNGGKGCVGCHAPHSGGAGNGGNQNNTLSNGSWTYGVDTEHSGNLALFGQDLGPLYNYALTNGAGDAGQTYTQWINGGVDTVKYLDSTQKTGTPTNSTYNTWQLTACAGCDSADLRRDKLYTSGTVTYNGNAVAVNDPAFTKDANNNWTTTSTLTTTKYSPTTYTLPGVNQFETREQEVTGIMMCLSCHDGNIAKGAMMQNASYEQKFGLLPAGAYGTAVIPTLLGNDGTAAGNYSNDHPIGPDANLGAVGVAGNFYFAQAGCGNGGYDCLKVKSTATAYLKFVEHYGAPNIISNGHGAPVVIVDSAPQKSFLVCTTCHTPHSMYVFKSDRNGDAPIATFGGKLFPTYFFIAAPYNPGTAPNANQASSATQFCRQCHFTGAGGSNEGSGIFGVTTAF